MSLVGVEAIASKITLNSSGLRNGVAFYSSRAVLHLTKGYTQKDDTETMAHAWTAEGEAPAQSKSGTAGDESFGFLQTQEVTMMKFFYAGEKRSDGSMTVDVDSVLNPKICLDTEDDVAPWTSSNRRLSAGVWTAKTGDHPAVRCSLKIGNTVTGKANYLFHVLDRRRFVTTLTYRMGTTYVTMRYFEWAVSHDVMFRWVGGKPQVKVNRGTNSFGEVKVGAPSGKAAAQFKKPSRPFANAFTRNTMTSVVLGDLTGRAANKEWFMNVPNDFWT